MRCCQHFGVCGRHHVRGEWEEGVCRSCSAHKAGGVEQGTVQCEVAQWLRWQKWHDTRACPFCIC